MKQFPEQYIKKLLNSGITEADIVHSIFISNCSDEDLYELDIATFFMEADLSSLNPDIEYEVTDASPLGGM